MTQIKKTFIAAAVLLCVICLLSLTVSADGEYYRVDNALLYGRAELAKLENGSALVKTYDLILDAVENGQSTITLNTMHSVKDIVITCEQLNTVAGAYRFDQPQNFWLNNITYYYWSNGTVAEIVLEYFDYNIPTVRQTFHNACLQVIANAGVTEGMSEYEITKRLYDAVASLVEYDYTYASSSYNAYGAVMTGKAVCEGYAELYQYLLYLNGIQSHVVTGDAGGPHAWNLVRIDGSYYQTDVTWGDPGGLISYQFLNTTTAQISESRYFYDHGYPFPQCDSIAASYFTVECGGDSYFYDTPSVENAIQQIRKKGEARFLHLGNGDFGFGAWIGNSINDIGYALDFYGSFSYYGFMDEYVMTAVDYVIPPEPEAGDVDGDEVITADDAVYIIYNLTFGSREYPLNQSCDYDGDGSVTPKDAAYLLYHIFFGEEEFPLH